MKKILALSLVAMASLLTFIGLNISANKTTAFAEENNLIITSNYFEPGLFGFEIYNTIEKIDTMTNLYNGYIDDLDEVRIFINNETGTPKYNSTYVNSLDAVYVNGSDVPAIKVGGEDYYLAEVSNGKIDVKIVFDVEKFEINGTLNVPNLESGAIADNDYVKYYKIEDGQKALIEKDTIENKYFINYGETLIIEPAQNLTYNTNAISYTFDKLLISFKTVGDIDGVYQYSITDTFIKSSPIFNKVINIEAVFRREKKVSVDFGKASYAVAYKLYKVTGDVETEVSVNSFFEDGVKLRLKFTLSEQMQLAKLNAANYLIGGYNYAAETDGGDKVEINGNDVSITFNLISDKKLTIYLDAVSFKVDYTNTLENAEVRFNEENFIVGDMITIYSTITANNYELKDWIIKGVKVPKVGETDSEYGITRIDENTVIIDTAKWYAVNKNNFDVTITTKFKTSIILAIVLPVGVTVAAGLVLLFIILQNIKTKKKIHALLEAEKEMQYKMNPVSLISDLREGKSTTVTDEDVKAAMKKKNVREKAEKMAHENDEKVKEQKVKKEEPQGDEVVFETTDIDEESDNNVIQDDSDK